LVITGPQRTPLFPDLPTMSESGYPGFDVSGKFGFIVPAGTPKDVIATLNKALNQALAHPDLVKQLGAQGAQVAATTPKEFDDLIKAESATWLKVLRDAKIKND
jgi:tripartite-type tricarboxylate transporter receptor subunit TctC